MAIPSQVSIEVEMPGLYDQRSSKAWAVNKLKALFIPNSLQRLSRKNELGDYKALLSSKDDSLWDLHRRLEEIRHDGTANYDSYDYGSGYYYQSFAPAQISGFRDTETRVDQLKLRERLKGMSVLDIGSNTGFVLLSASDEIKRGVGIEFNPYLVRTAGEVRDHLGADQMEFVAGAFEDFKTDERFDAVLSLANHSTYDGNTKHDLDSYFGKVSEMLNDGGQILFESHPPKIEPSEKLKNTLSVIEQYFEVEERPAVSMTRFLDKDRTYVIGRKK